MRDPDVKIVIAAHKKYRMPADEIYLPLHVGAEGKTDENGQPLELGYVKDNTGEHISELNPSFCELTALYWAWKNLKADYIGLAHYRRHFGNPGQDPLKRVASLAGKGGDPFDYVLTGENLIPLLRHYGVFVPKKRNYYIESLYSHYAHTHYAGQLDMTREIMEKLCPEYLTSFDRVMKRKWGYMFNMMILRRDYLDSYCSWLFPILFALKDRCEEMQADGEEDGQRDSGLAGGLSAYQGRFYGRVSELIFNVWLDYQLETGNIKQRRVFELPYLYMEKIDYIRKGKAFLTAKLFHRRYEGSF